MPLQLGTSGSGSGLGHKISEGVFGKKGPIIHARQEMDKKLGDYQPDIFITLEVKRKGEFNDEIDIFGSFSHEKNPDGSYSQAISGWGSAFKVDATLKELGAYEGLSEDQMKLEGNRLPLEALENLIGKQVYYLIYCAGKNRNKEKPIWNLFWKVLPAKDDSAPEEDQAAWEQLYSDLAQDDYHYGKLIKGREYLASSSNESGDTDFNFGSNASSDMYDEPNQPPLGGDIDDQLPI